MDWAQILLKAGIPEPPGRNEAYIQAILLTEEKCKRNAQKRAKRANGRKPAEAG